MSQAVERMWVLRKEVHKFLYGREGDVPYGESDDIAELLAAVLNRGHSHFHIESHLRSFVREDYEIELGFGVAFQEAVEVVTSPGMYEVDQFDGDPDSMEEAASRQMTFVLRTPTDRNLLESVLGPDTHNIEDLRVFFDIGKDGRRFLSAFHGLTRLSILAQSDGFQAKSLKSNPKLKRLSLSGRGGLDLSGIESAEGLEHLEIGRFQKATGLSALQRLAKLSYAYIEDIGVVDDADLVMNLHTSGVADVLGYAAWTNLFPGGRL